MISLFIDTHDKDINLVLYKDGTILDKNIKESERHHSDFIMPMLKELLDRNNLTVHDLNEIFVVNGPGSFTGVRVGITVAKTISWGLNIPVYPISTLQYLASINTDKNRIISIIDARRGNVFVGVYDRDLNLLDKEKLISYSDLIINDDDIIVSYDGIYNSSIIKNDIIKLINYHLNDEDINPHHLIPNYLKKTEAEEKLND